QPRRRAGKLAKILPNRLHVEMMMKVEPLAGGLLVVRPESRQAGGQPGRRQAGEKFAPRRVNSGHTVLLLLSMADRPLWPTGPAHLPGRLNAHYAPLKCERPRSGRMFYLPLARVS